MNKLWQNYVTTERTGKLCYHYCSAHSDLPIRDVLADHHDGNKPEPNYESATYNWYASCNQPSVRAAVRDGLSHILFITRYSGQRSKYQDQYFIDGYYEIGWTAQVEGRTVIRAKRMCFTPIEKAYKVTDERWQRINTIGHTQRLVNLHHSTQRIRGELLNEIIGHLDRGNATDAFLREVSRLKAEYNPYETVPSGRVFIINVGANTASSLQSPTFNDGTFEFMPISEYAPLDSQEVLSFADLRQFNHPDKPMLDLFPKASISPTEKMHNDPEFMTLTYGDNIQQKGNLQDLQPGDFLFFLARLVPYENNRFQHEKAFFALVGYLEIAEILEDPDSPFFNSPAFVRNAHVKRWSVDHSSFDKFAVFKGSNNSRRFRYAARFDPKFVEHVPLRKADGSSWEWDRTTELGIIGANTRTVRMYIDPQTADGREQVERFWHYIWETQKWNDAGGRKKAGC